MELELGKVIATIINFLILYFILRHFFFDKLQNVLKQRENIILEKINSATEKEEKAELLLKERENIIIDARAEGKKIVEKRKLQGDRIYDELIEKAKINTKELEERKLRELGLEKEKALDELKQESVSIAISLSEKILEKELDEEEQKRIIDNFIENLEV